MKKIILVIALVMGLAMGADAQKHQLTPEQQQQFFNAKVKRMQRQLNLTEQQTVQFIPLYKRYQESLKSVKRPERVAKDAALTRDKAYQVAIAQLKYKESILKVQEKYLGEFKEILTPQQILKFERAETSIQQSLNMEKQKRENKRPNGGKPKAKGGKPSA